MGEFKLEEFPFFMYGNGLTDVTLVSDDTDDFLEKFQTVFDTPPPSFLENHIADFATKVRMFIMAGLLCII